MAQRGELDERALLGLLWRGSDTSPRRGLSTQSVTAAAIDLADGEGIDAVTIRRLAQEAGVSAMALYPHIGGRAELVELMLDRVAGATYGPGGVPDGDGWRARVTAIAEANWANCQAHPWLTDVATGRSVPGPGVSAKYEAELRALDGIGLSDLELEYTLTALLSLVQGTARAAIASMRARRPDEADGTDWWATLEPALAEAIGDASRFPTAARVSRSLGEATGKANDPDGAFRHGVHLFLEGIARRVGESQD